MFARFAVDGATVKARVCGVWWGLITACRSRLSGSCKTAGTEQPAVSNTAAPHYRKQKAKAKAKATQKIQRVCVWSSNRQRCYKCSRGSELSLVGVDSSRVPSTFGSRLLRRHSTLRGCILILCIFVCLGRKSSRPSVHLKLTVYFTVFVAYRPTPSPTGGIHMNFQIHGGVPAPQTIRESPLPIG